jgi:hypothetical protein
MREADSRSVLERNRGKLCVYADGRVGDWVAKARAWREGSFVRCGTVQEKGEIECIASKEKLVYWLYARGRE